MCQDCKSSKLGLKRQAELDAAIAACKELNLNTGTAGFIAKYSMPTASVPRRYRSGVIQFSNEEKAALGRYNNAASAMKQLHEDYLFSAARQENLRILQRRAETATGDELLKICVRIAYIEQLERQEPSAKARGLAPGRVPMQ